MLTEALKDLQTDPSMSFSSLSSRFSAIACNSGSLAGMFQEHSTGRFRRIASRCAKALASLEAAEAGSRVATDGVEAAGVWIAMCMLFSFVLAPTDAHTYTCLPRSMIWQWMVASGAVSEKHRCLMEVGGQAVVAIV